ncbi:MAG: DUF2461 domain-containing protein [Flavobacteriales bacterium]|nr:DUF2461 domain-containing protein [Flavobacteriales bacterium]
MSKQIRMDHISADTLKFLKELKKNNNRDWFQKHKKRYELAQAGLIDFVDQLTPALAKFDKNLIGIEPKKTVFRIYRDVRFSKNKQPYKLNMGAHIQGGTKMEPKAGYYIHLEPGNCFLAGGAYNPPAAWLKAIRSEIDYNAEDLKKVLRAKSFKTYFGQLQGDKLKTSPRDYTADHPEIEFLRMKSFLAVHDLTDSLVTGKGFLSHCKKVFKALYPLDAYLNMALD